MEKVDSEDIYPFFDEFDIEACINKSTKRKKSFWNYFCCCFRKDKRLM